MPIFKQRAATAFVLVLATMLAPWLSWSSHTRGQEASKTTQAKNVDEKEILALITALGDESFEKREAAEKSLTGVGRPALATLRKAANEAADLEVRDRAARLVRMIGAGPGPGAVFPDSCVRDLAISKDGQTLAISCDNKTVRVYDWKTLELRQTLTGHTNRVWAVAISPDGRTLASSSGAFADGQSHEITIWDLAKGQASRTLKGHEGAAFSLVFSPDGTKLYSGGWDGTVRVWDPATGKEIGVLTGHKGFVRRVHLSPDGKYIVSCGLDSTVRFWNRESLKEERRMVTTHDGIGPSAFSPDGKLFITGSRPAELPDPGIVTVWDVATGKEKTTIQGPTRKVTGLAVSPDSKLLAMGGGLMGQMGEVKILDLATGKELATFHDHKEWVEGLAFSPDGLWLASGSGYFGKAGEIRIWDVQNRRGKGE